MTNLAASWLMVERTYQKLHEVVNDARSSLGSDSMISMTALERRMKAKERLHGVYEQGMIHHIR
jgi:hypothetical protein